MNKPKASKLKLFATCLMGLGIGAVNGLLGGGGGMLAVPALRVSGLDTKKAHATAIAVMLPLCVVSALVYTLRGIFEVKTGLISCALVTAGGIGGALLLNRLPKQITSLVFYVLMTLAGVRSIVRWVGSL